MKNLLYLEPFNSLNTHNSGCFYTDYIEFLLPDSETNTNTFNFFINNVFAGENVFLNSKNSESQPTATQTGKSAFFYRLQPVNFYLSTQKIIPLADLLFTKILEAIQAFFSSDLVDDFLYFRNQVNYTGFL